MNLLQRDVKAFLNRARLSGCESEVRNLVDKLAFSAWGPSIRRRINSFIRDFEAEAHPEGIARQTNQTARKDLLSPKSSWGLSEEGGRE